MLVACLALAYAASFVVADFTRVTTLCALPLIIYLAQQEAAHQTGRAWLSSSGTACLCLIQMQIADFDLLHDSSWPQYVLKSMRGMSWW